MNEKIKFKDKKINREDLNRILEVGMLSPTVKSLQPQKIYVIESEKELDKIQKITNIKSPTILMVCGDAEKCYREDHFVSYLQDCLLVSTHMILEAIYLGIDIIYDKELNFGNQLEKEFNLDINSIPVSLIYLGYKTDDSIGCKTSDFSCNLLPKYKKDKKQIVKYI